MKQIFIASSRKFYPEVKQIIQQLKANNVLGLTPMTDEMDESETGEKTALTKAFLMIDNVDEIYVFAKDGYIGNTVAMEMAYAHAKNKKIIASEEITDPSAKAIITKIIDPKSYLKHVIHES